MLGEAEGFTFSLERTLRGSQPDHLVVGLKRMDVEEDGGFGGQMTRELNVFIPSVHFSTRKIVWIGSLSLASLLPSQLHFACQK